MSTEIKNTHYYPALDGLRGVAILLVVIYHNFGFVNYFSFGWLGVDLFFVLSGFLITNILISSVGKSGYLRNFYFRRILRIFPLYYFALLLFLFILPIFFHIPNVSYYKDNQFYLWTYLQNWLFIFKITDTSSMHHLWSLAVEEQFYLIWPIIILIIRNPKILLILLSLTLSAVIALRLWAWLNTDANFSYYHLYTFSRIDGICIGSMVALINYINPAFLRKFTSAIVLFFAILNFIFFFINRMYQFSFPYLALAGYTTFAMLFGLLVNEAVNGGIRIINFILNVPILKFFGRISYGFYVFHWPIFLISTPFISNWLSRFISGYELQVASGIIASFIGLAISWLSYNYYEKPFLKLKEKLT